MPSFDIVHEVDKVELQNAVDNSTREISNRYDFRGVVATVELKELDVTLTSESDFQVEQVLDIFRNAASKRNISLSGIDIPSKPTHSGKTYSLTLAFKQGIEQDLVKKIIKDIKNAKLKVQASIQGDKVRVTGKKRDDLQETIQLVKSLDIELSLKFENFRD